MLSHVFCVTYEELSKKKAQTKCNLGGRDSQGELESLTNYWKTWCLDLTGDKPAKTFQ